MNIVHVLPAAATGLHEGAADDAIRLPHAGVSRMVG